MGQYHKFMNFDKKEILNPPGLLKLMEWSYQQNEYMLQIENLLKTSWKGDRVLVIGDYADDFYDYNGKPIFGELTFTPAGCIDKNYTDEAQLKLGELINLK